MNSFFRKYLPFTKAVLQTHVTYRMNFLFFMFGRIMRVIVSVYLWFAIFMSSGKSTMSGFDLPEILIYIVISDIIANLVMSPTCMDTIPNEVRSGMIAMNLLKPINYHFQLMFSSIGNVVNALVYYGLPVFIVTAAAAYFISGIVPPGPVTVAAFILSVIMSFLIYFFISFFIGTAALFTTSIWGISMSAFAIINFFSGRLIPLSFFPDTFKIITEFLPFSSMIYTPAMIYMEKLTGLDMLYKLSLQFAWILILGGCALLFWRKAIKKLTILGG